jgi:uncharacterized protein (TIGR02145 family)
MDQIFVSESESNSSDINSLELTSSSTVNYLMDLINTIESMAEDRLLNKGNANALIVKIENAIKSIEKGNTNAFSGQLNALINEVEDFIDNGVLTKTEGETLINKVETGIILFEGGITDPNDGYEYRVVLIGDQLWMAENLRAIKFNDGTDIPLVTDNTEWSENMFLSSPAYCWYNNDYDNFGNTYGALYNWYTVETGKLCPIGWHVPSDLEWHKMISFLDPNANSIDPPYTYPYESEIAGGLLKETGTSHWENPNEGAINEFGFTALPGGFRYPTGEFEQEGTYGIWWSNNIIDPNQSWYRGMEYINSWVHRSYHSMNHGNSIRCVKD